MEHILWPTKLHRPLITGQAKEKYKSSVDLVAKISVTTWKGYVVLNRPWAFVRWLEKATIEEETWLESYTLHKWLSNFSYPYLKVWSY
ncbi:hypothetical protein CMV_022728 [Castanea mollissima]|uniref:Hydroxyproline O-arabinosyltransferase-like domain-containing protein n=1 Tax=Castanea mollissima TaxID=60419 RepID=A0A8J4VJF5_9ROSI|nr:hypothetical protein CMV_022728 [Castanea mollissima]